MSSEPGNVVPQAPEPDNNDRPPTRLEVLFEVSNQLKESLEPVAPSTRFRQELRDKLSGNVDKAREIMRNAENRRANLRLGAVLLGGVVFVGSMLALGIRLGLILLSRITGIGRSKPASAARK